jgi:hypothetical protein
VPKHHLKLASEATTTQPTSLERGSPLLAAWQCISGPRERVELLPVAGQPPPAGQVATAGGHRTTGHVATADGHRTTGHVATADGHRTTGHVATADGHGTTGHVASKVATADGHVAR